MTHSIPSNQNVGHGHVFPRPDGVRARCGGPGICAECSKDAYRKDGSEQPSSNLVAALRGNAEAWGVTSDTPDDAVMNETWMARDCAWAADEIDRLQQDNRRYESGRVVLTGEIDDLKKKLSARLQQNEELRMAERLNVETVSNFQKRIDELERENQALRNLANNLRPGPISEALAGSMDEDYRRAGLPPSDDPRVPERVTDEAVVLIHRYRQSLAECQCEQGEPGECNFCRAGVWLDVVRQQAAQPPPPVPARTLIENLHGYVRETSDQMGYAKALQAIELALGASQPPAASRDAERYRFLRHPDNAIVYAKDRNAWGANASGHVRYDTPEQLDAAVDAARDAVTKAAVREVPDERWIKHDADPFADAPLTGPGSRLEDDLQAMRGHETDDRQWLIRKRGYYYRPNRAGYTANVAEAGRYTETEAKAEAAIEPAIMQAVPLQTALSEGESHGR